MKFDTLSDKALNKPSEISEINAVFSKVFSDFIPSVEKQLESVKLSALDARNFAEMFINCYRSYEHTLYYSIINSFISTLDINLRECKIKISDKEKDILGNLVGKWPNIAGQKQIGFNDYLNFKEDISSLKKKIFSDIVENIEKGFGIEEKEEILENLRIWINNYLRKSGNSTLLIENPRMNKMVPLEFEYFVARLFNLMGYKTDVTPGSGDFGIDVIAKKDSEVIGIQCKKYDEKNKISNREIQMFLGALQLKGRSINKGIFITTSVFTDQAYRQADGNNVDLWDGKKLKKIMNEYLLKGTVIKN